MMSFKAWLKWYRAQSWYFKWFILLVVFRPVIDNFYYLKEISPLLSPLYIIGVLTPLLIVLSFISRSFKPKYRAPIADLVFGLWSTLILINCLIVVINDYSMDLLGDIIKYSTPVLLFYYARHVVQSRDDLMGLLQAFLLGCFFPAIILVYEQVFGAIAPEQLSANRGSGERVQGAYADIMNYAIYIVGSFLISTYLVLRQIKLRRFNRKAMLWLGIIVLLDLVALVSIKQVSTFIVFAALVGLFMFFLVQSRQSFGILILALPLALILGKTIYDRNMKDLVAKEVKVIEGDADVNRSFNGRMDRWKRYFDLWGEMPGHTFLVGVPSSGAKEVRAMIGGGMHSDFVRILFFTGFGGLLTYLFFLLILFIKSRSLNSYDRYLVFGTLLALLLHSVSTTPFLYAPYTYLLMIVFSYTLLPVRVINGRA